MPTTQMNTPAAFVLVYHLTKNADQHFIGGLGLPVVLRIIRYQPSVFYPVPDECGMNLFVNEWSSIVGYNFVEDPEVKN